MQPINYSPALPASSSTNPQAIGSNGIQYNGGPVMNASVGVNVYLIWYGDWSTDTLAQTIVTDFVKNIGGSLYFNINTTYYDFDINGQQDPVRNKVNYAGSISDNYSQGTALSDNQVGFIVDNAILAGKLPRDLNGVYFVITSADVMETSGFCTAYCAFHGWTARPVDLFDNLKVAFVGNPVRCPTSCAAQYLTPNNDFAGDTMVDSIAHELSESVTDPLGTAWFTNSLLENGDLCVFNFGNYKPLPNGSYYNLRLGQHLYLSQQIWVNARGGYCALSWDE